MRAREPDESGYAVNDGIRVYYEIHGTRHTNEPTVMLMPPWAIAHSRFWKFQIPYLATHFRTVCFDPRGNGRTDRPPEPERYGAATAIADTLEVMDATDTASAIMVGHCVGSTTAMLIAAAHPDRVRGIVAINASVLLTPGLAPRRAHSRHDVLDTDEGWAKDNVHYWARDWPGFVEFFIAQMTVEPHSTKVYDDAVGWGLETDAVTMLAEGGAACVLPETSIAQAEAMVRSLTCPVLAITGDTDRIIPKERSERLAELVGGDLLMIRGGGHLPQARHPVVVNQAIRTFIERISPPHRRSEIWLLARDRHPRALWVSSPIGLGHIHRDLAIARALRARIPQLRIEWLAQDPVTQVLAAAGEVVHPASQDLASESAHMESEAVQDGGHELHAFRAYRRMDDILCANYLRFDDVVRESPFDLWVGDESWEIDHFLHENPERKIAPFVFTTDVVGFLPVTDDPREAELTADYNAEMIEHRERFPSIRDLSLFIGAYDELPDASFGPGLPRIRDWTARWFDTVPYIVPFDPNKYQDTAALRRRLGYNPDVPLIAAAVGGTAVGRTLLNLIAESFHYLRKDLPQARFLIITGPRIDPAEMPDVDGLEVVGFLDEAAAHLAAADVAVVQGGLSTTMELVAARRPFVYFPMGLHWEQQHFVAHRLNHYRAGIRMDYSTTTPADLAATLQRAIGRKTRYRAVPSHGARRAAERIAHLLPR